MLFFQTDTVTPSPLLLFTARCQRYVIVTSALSVAFHDSKASFVSGNNPVLGLIDALFPENPPLFVGIL